MAVLGLHCGRLALCCCMQATRVVASRLPIAVAPFIEKNRFWGTQASIVVAHIGRAASWHVVSVWDLSSRTRDWIQAPCIGRQSLLNQWTTWEVPGTVIFIVLWACISLMVSQIHFNPRMNLPIPQSGEPRTRDKGECLQLRKQAKFIWSHLLSYESSSAEAMMRVGEGLE